MKIKNCVRVLVVGLCLGLAAPAVAQNAEASAMENPALSTEFAFEIHVELGPIIERGEGHDGRRRFVPISGGTFSGPEIEGVVLPGGGDWQAIGEDGLTVVHARYFLQASDGTTIDVDNVGVRVASPEVIQRLTNGELVSPDEYYFRTNPRFTIAGDKHAWLSRNLFVAQGIRYPDNVVIRVYRVK